MHGPWNRCPHGSRSASSPFVKSSRQIEQLVHRSSSGGVPPTRVARASPRSAPSTLRRTLSMRTVRRPRTRAVEAPLYVHALRCSSRRSRFSYVTVDGGRECAREAMHERGKRERSE